MVSSTQPTPLTPPANRRDTPPDQYRGTSHAASLTNPRLATIRAKTSPSSLPGSEPSLRFPKPQGNRHLATWVLSSSNPDISAELDQINMAATTSSVAATPIVDDMTDDSSYDIISGTDTESQEDYNESMGESIGSLDFHRPDDVHSLAGTEHTHDGEDEQSEVDEADPISVATETFPEFSIETIKPADAEPDLDDEAHSDDEVSSRSSLDYTRESLGAPSLPTPEASDILVRPTSGKLWTRIRAEALSIYKREQHWLMPLLITLVALGASVLTLPLGSVFQQNRATPPAISAPSTVHTTAQLSSVRSPLSATTTAPSALSTSTSSGGFDLVPVTREMSDDWLFRPGKTAVVQFSAHSSSEILVRTSPSNKRKWLGKDCLSISATRDDGNLVGTNVSSTDEGIIIRFPKQETYGMLTLDFETTCRPRLRKVVKAHFTKGIMEEVLEMTKSIAHDLGGLVPAAAHEAERRLGIAKRSIGAASDNLGLSVHGASDILLRSLNSTVASAHRSLESASGKAKQTALEIRSLAVQINGKIPDVAELQSQFHLGLLESQISAKLWWLKATGRHEDHAMYKEKARLFMAMKRAQAAPHAEADKATLLQRWVPWSA
jgi:hypothetical protein